ncbi:M1 family metallopeptidase [Marivirga sp. S37H4]|uniref:Aminopeptidase N n=1 Tax=Marivirga aurantiaca TaxID=2802615 RepID=A0A935C9F4_9BACT|nr:M1 family metallopeptidase [Marivirga aurantiaca]MBK6265959.1 M1 family metallopeptidase [Marivirga aurantiaca]
MNNRTKEGQLVQKTDLLVNDPHSFARPQVAKITHLNWEAEVSFERKVITAKAVFTIQASKKAGEIIFDTKNLKIHKVLSNDSLPIANFRFGKGNDIMGMPLIIPIDKNTQSVAIYYETTNTSEALQWLEPEQTAGKQHPFLFTQSQAILCRSWIPIQDSPAIRFSYSAKVKVPENFMALMSAENPQKIDTTGNYQFEMQQAIPAYLMALAVGNLTFDSTGSRTGVYAEPVTIEKAKYELEDMASMLETAESLYGAYRWDRFDVLFLPPSFPFGGMENPRLTFATPTILAGDKSLTSLIAHELAHSWSGNLVTNATWNDFWLNEGFTVYFENRIIEAMYGKDYADMLALISYRDLQSEIDSLIKEGKASDTHLKLNLEGRNPDEGMTSIAYDKGFFFLKTLEQLAGRERFDTFLNKYFDDHAFQSMHTQAFILYLEQYLFGKYNIEIPENFISEWLYEEGMPEGFVEPVSKRFNKVDSVLIDWLKGEQVDSLSNMEWSTHEWLHFLQQLPDSAGVNEMRKLDAEMSFTESGNSEILMEWFLLALRNNYFVAYPKIEEFLVETGRRKLVMPLYAEMIKTSQGRRMALNIYQKARPNYHFVTYHSLDKLLKE